MVRFLKELNKDIKREWKGVSVSRTPFPLPHSNHSALNANLTA